MKTLILLALLVTVAIAVLIAFRRKGTKSPQEDKSRTEHAVIISFDYGSSDLGPLFELEEQLKEAIDAANAGEFDGNEIALSGSDGSLFMYGPDADRLFEAVWPVLDSTAVIRNIKANLRYGPPEEGVRERTITIAKKHK